jgi:hypothetical protein
MVYKEPKDDDSTFKSIELEGAIVGLEEPAKFSIQPRGQPRVYWFRCKDNAERRVWIAAINVFARPVTTQGVDVIYRHIPGSEFVKASEAMKSTCRVPANVQLELTIWYISKQQTTTTNK